MTKKDIDLKNKCGSCHHFKPIDDTCSGECLMNPYGENVVHDPAHPHWIVTRSRAKCNRYNAPPKSNGDWLRSLDDEALAEILVVGVGCVHNAPHCMNNDCRPCICNWLRQPHESEG